MVGNITLLMVNAESLKLYFDFIDMPDVKRHGTLTTEKRADFEYEIAFKNVSFKYPGGVGEQGAQTPTGPADGQDATGSGADDGYALRNLNLSFKVGKRLAVVGMNGSGKTTMIKLLCRLYDPTEGEITLNGVDIRKYNYREYFDLFSVVFQDFKLFSFSLGQNVAASVDYDGAKALSCLEKAGFADRLKTLPRKLETPLYKDFDEDGVEISGGEAQKIALARTLYRDAPFVILDEPTAALDPLAEYEVYSRFNDIIGEKTAVFISHRLSSCRFCDDIAVFHEGRLIQRGSHETLLADGVGKYHELWNAQAQYYTSDNE
jgi:ATP-binding cassette subfamily B protein